MWKRSLILALFLVGCGGAQAPEEKPVATAEVPAEPPTEPVEVADEPVTPVAEHDPNDPLSPPADVAAIPEDATKTATGLAYKVLTPAPAGAKVATPTSTVTAHYTGWLTNGERFDSSVERGEPATFPLTKVIDGWKQGVGSMAEGEKRRLWIPEDLAYKGRPGKPAGMLVFDVELIKIEE